MIRVDGRRVLDVGSGVFAVPGYITGTHPQQFVGVDPLLPAVPPPFDVVRALGERLPFKDRSFDVVILATSLDHMLDVESALIEIGRVLAVGGDVYFWGGMVDIAERWGDHGRSGALPTRAGTPRDLWTGSESEALAAWESDDEALGAFLSEALARPGAFDEWLVDEFHFRHFSRAMLIGLTDDAGFDCALESSLVDSVGVRHDFFHFRSRSPDR